jgi:hypothetical protein
MSTELIIIPRGTKNCPNQTIIGALAVKTVNNLEGQEKGEFIRVANKSTEKSPYPAVSLIQVD